MCRKKCRDCLSRSIFNKIAFPLKIRRSLKQKAIFKKAVIQMSTEVSANAKVKFTYWILVLPPWAVFFRRPAPRNEGFSGHSHDITSTSSELRQSQLAFETGLFALLFQFIQMKQRGIRGQQHWWKHPWSFHNPSQKLSVYIDWWDGNRESWE